MGGEGDRAVVGMVIAILEFIYFLFDLAFCLLSLCTVCEPCEPESDCSYGLLPMNSLQ